MSVKDMIKKEAAASEKAEADWNKAHEARLNKPTKPFKPQRQQQQQQQQPKPQGGKGRKGRRKRKRYGRQQQQQHQQQQQRVRLNTQSLALVKPPKKPTPFVKQPLAQNICYACGLTGHIKAHCPTNP